MKTSILLLLISILVASISYSCDDSDPRCVASILVESSIKFENRTLETYYCEADRSTIWAFDKLSQSLDEVQKDEKLKYKDLIFDFSELKYDQVRKTEKRAKIRVRGKISAHSPNVDFNKTNNVDFIYELFKIDGKWFFCPSLTK